MSSVFSGSFSGSFKSTGNSQFISLPSGFDLIRVANKSQMAAAGAGQAVEAWFDLATDINGRGFQVTKTAATNASAWSQIAVNAGFFIIDTSINNPGPSVALTGITNGNPPVVNTGSTAGLIPGSSIVRIFSTVGAQQLGGLDFTVGTVVANTSFTLAYMAQIANANPGAGTYRIIPYDPYFYPTIRYITKIVPGPNANVPLSANVTVITLSVTHGYKIGQKVRLDIPTVTPVAFGMTELDGQEVTIVNIGDQDADGVTNTITVDVNSTGFTAFAFPLTAGPSFTPAQVVPIGEQTSQAEFNTFFPANSGQDIYSDATLNIAQQGLLLMAGANSPAGQSGDVISWTAWKSFNT